MAKILIISDLHLGAERQDIVPYKHNDIKADMAPISEDQLERLGDAIIQKYKGNPLDVLVFLGDCVRGQDKETERKLALERFTDFLKCLQNEGVFSVKDGLQERIVVIPGNHDVVRTVSEPERILFGKKSKSKIISGSLDQFKETFSQYLTPFTEKGNDQSIKRFGAPVFVFDELGLILSCFSTVSLDNGEMPSILTNAQKAFDKANKTLKTASKFSKYKNYARIMFSHSPLVTLESGKTVVKYNNTIGGYNLLQTAAYNGYNLFFHGHTHQFVTHAIKNLLEPDLLNAVQISVPQCIYAEKPDNVGLNVVEVETINNESTYMDSEKITPCSYKIRCFSVDAIRKMFKETRPLVSDKRQESVEIVGDRILVDAEIEEILKEGIVIKKGDSSRIEAASYDCALGVTYKREKTVGGYNWDDDLEEITPNEDGIADIKLQPNQTVLIYTEEEFDLPLDMVFHASPISSWARKGLRVDISYFVDPGFCGPFCFPVTNMSNHEISISSQEKIMSIELIKIARAAEKGWAQRNPTQADMRQRRGE